MLDYFRDILPRQGRRLFCCGLISCSKYDFFKKVQSEEAEQFILLPYNN